MLRRDVRASQRTTRPERRVGSQGATPSDAATGGAVFVEDDLYNAEGGVVLACVASASRLVGGVISHDPGDAATLESAAAARRATSALTASSMLRPPPRRQPVRDETTAAKRARPVLVVIPATRAVAGVSLPPSQPAAADPPPRASSSSSTGASHRRRHTPPAAATTPDSPSGASVVGLGRPRHTDRRRRRRRPSRLNDSCRCGRPRWRRAERGKVAA